MGGSAIPLVVTLVKAFQSRIASRTAIRYGVSRF